MKSFWLGLAGSFVGVMLLAAMAFYTDIFTIDKDGAPKFRVSDAGKITVGATESYVNLVIQNDEVAAEADNKVDITANVLTVEGIRLENVAVSANIESSAAGGLDTGSEATSTWYYVWVITNNDGTSSNGLLSASSTSPTLPSGFTKKRRVGAVRNDVGNNFLQFVQEGNKVSYMDGINNHRILSLGTSAVWTSLPASECQKYLPPVARRGILWMLNSVRTATVGLSVTLRVRTTGFTGTGGGRVAVSVLVQTTASDIRESLVVDVDTNANQQIDYYMENGASITNGGAFIDVLGYYDRI